MRHIDFTSGPVGRKILLFSLPLMVGNVFQQLYNVVDTLVVGKFLGEAPLAAVGSAYTLMIFLTSILIGLTMGAGVYFSLCFGRKNFDRMKQAIFISFLSIGLLSVIMNGAAYIFLDGLIFLHAGAFRGHSLYPGLFIVDICRAIGGVPL